MTNEITHGLWIDDAPALVRTRAYWQRVRDLGFTEAAIMLESVADTFDPKYDVLWLAAIAEFAASCGIKLIITVWPEPRASYLAVLESRIDAYLSAADAIALESDGESNWTKRRVVGYPNLDKAGDALVAFYDRVREKQRKRNPNFRIEFTTFPEHTENSERADVAPGVDLLFPQAYPVRNRSNGPVPWDALYGPARMVDHTLARARLVRGVKEGRVALGCALAAYDQKWPDHTIAEAMTLAREDALKHGVKNMRWWSSKWIVGKMANPEVAAWFRSLR